MFFGNDAMLGDRLKGRDNNFNLMRFIAAIAVLMGHCYPLALGVGAEEPLSHSLGQSLGGFAVDTFFIISGFLVTQSLLYRESVGAFLIARLLRIYPGLIVMVVLTVFVLGPLVTTASLREYGEAPLTLSYLLKCSTLIGGLRFQLPGVFEGNPFALKVNGSLWTMPYEVKMYLWLVGLWWVLGVRPSLRDRLFAFGIQGIALYAVFMVSKALIWGHEVTPFLRLTAAFSLGSAMYILKDRIPVSGGLLVLALAFFGLSMFRKSFFMWVYLPLMPYLVLSLATVPGGFIRRFNRLGDYSYGVYIYAFPIQQTLAMAYPGITPLEMMPLAAALSLLFGIVSWHLVESPCLRLKRSKSPAPH